MKILLHDIGSGAYFRGPTEWTHDRREALNFIRTAEAVKLAASLRLDNAEVVMDFDDAYDDVTLRLKSRWLSTQNQSQTSPGAGA
jgi:hypothetical protein